MPQNEKMSPETIEDAWRTYLEKGEMPDYIGEPWYHKKIFRSLYLHLPHDPRCRLCYYPFKGVGGAIMRRVFGVQPSKLNPQLCNECERFAEEYHGGAEVEMSLLFADVRGSTALAETMNPTEYSRLINRFYNAVTKILYDSSALVEKLIGDQVTGIFTPGFAGRSHANKAIKAAREILRATGHGDPAGPWIPVGVGVHTGTAYVGSVNSDAGVSDIAVLGDAANLGARLASLARRGEILISQATAQAAEIDRSTVEVRQSKVKGRNEPVEVWVLDSQNAGG